MRWYRFAALSSSLPVRGAWIEITRILKISSGLKRRSPCGERGLKWLVVVDNRLVKARRSPCGERGLKFQRQRLVRHQRRVAPRAGSVD